MKPLGMLLAAALVIAAALAILLLITLVYEAFAHPRKTIGLLGFGAALALIERQPLAVLGLLALLAIVKLLREKADGPG